MINEASYYIVIPGSVRADKRLNAEQKLLYGEIASKTYVTGYCWATNKRLCELMACTERTLQRNLLELQRSNHIKVEVIRNESGTIRRIFLVDSRDIGMPAAVKVTPDAEDGTPAGHDEETPPANFGEYNTITTDKSNQKRTSALSRGGGNSRQKKGDEKPPRPHWQAFVDTFHDDYMENNHGEKPTIDGRPVGDLAKLYDRLQNRAKFKNVEWTEANVRAALKFFLKIARKSEWLKNHWLIKNLLEQYDSIYAREAAEGKPATVAKKQAPPASNEGSQAHINYLVERHKEGNLDERIIEPLYFDRLVSLNIMHPDDFKDMPGDTPDERKVEAVKRWLNYINKKQ